MSEIKIPHEFIEVFPKFIKKYLPGNVSKFDIQGEILPCIKYPNGKFGYFEQKRKLTQTDWMFHFFLSPKVSNGMLKASLSLSGLADDGTSLKWISIDIDDSYQMSVWETRLQPHLDLIGVEYFIEWGGDEVDGEFNRCHVMIFFEDIDLATATEFTRQLFFNIDEPIFANEVGHFTNPDGTVRTTVDGNWFDEIFPINKPKNKIRPPFGYHCKKGRERRYPCEYKGVRLDTAITVMQGVIDCKSVTLDFIKNYVSPDVMQKLVSKINWADKISKRLNRLFSFYYLPYKLRLPVDNIPLKLQPVVRNCPAINKLLSDTVDKDFIEKTGDTHHYGQLMLRGVTKYLDARYKTDEGETFYNFLRENYRFRSDEDHQLERLEHEENPIRYFAGCEKWHKKFGLCGDCKFLEKITSPRQFIEGKVIKSEFIRQVPLSNVDWLRVNDLPKERQKLIEAVIAKSYVTKSFKYPQGCGKSVSIVRASIEELTGMGLKVIVAVNSTDLALEYKKDLGVKGINSFVLSSHKSTFDPKRKERVTDLVCPFFDEMQEMEKLGVSNSTIKETFCASCQHNSGCPYPRQYSEVLDPIHQVVIIQHAHFSCQEVMFDLMSKGFNIIYIDETFIESLFKFVPVSLQDIIALRGAAKQHNQPWAEQLADWLSCKTSPGERINPDETGLLLVKSYFDTVFLKWTVPDYIRLHNQKRLVNPVAGIEAIYEIPNLSVKAFTDATNPTELTRHLTGLENIEVVGENVLLDIKAIHPDNEIIQVLDFNSSVSWLENEEVFNLILEKIAKDIEEDDSNKRHLITAYLKDHGRIKTYFEGNHPTLLPKIEISAITKGVNRYSEFDTQTILANILFLGKDYYQTKYKYVQIANYHRLKKGLKPIPNLYPVNVDEKSQIPITWETVSRVVNGSLLEFPQFKVPKPAKGANEYDDNYWFRLIYEKTVGEIQQAIRVRLTKDKPRKITILNNVDLPSINTTQYKTLEQWLTGL
jgi:hypothetical protein